MRNTNFSRAKKWLNSAIADIKRVLEDLERDDFADVAFRSQFAVEKMNKAILNFFAIKVEKVHDPSTILDDFLKAEQTITLDDKIRKSLKDLIADSRVFENEGTKTRYGTIEQGELITAEEIYQSFEDVNKLIINLKHIIHHIIDFLNYSSKKANNSYLIEIVDKLKYLGEEIQKWT